MTEHLGAFHDEYFTFIDKLSDGSSSHFGCTWSVDVIPDGVTVHPPAPTGQTVDGESSDTSDKWTDSVEVDMLLGVTRHQLLQCRTSPHQITSCQET